MGDAGTEDFLWGLDAGDVVVGHAFVELVEVEDGKAGAATAGRGFLRIVPGCRGGFGGVEGEGGRLGVELGPVWSLELEREAEDVAVEGDGAVHVGDEDDGVGEVYGWTSGGDYNRRRARRLIDSTQPAARKASVAGSGMWAVRPFMISTSLASLLMTGVALTEKYL